MRATSEQRTGPDGIPGPVLRGAALPFLHRAAPHEVSLQELLTHLNNLGLRFARDNTSARPSKLLSDALRWSERRGFIERTGRGRYRYVHVPRTTLWRMQDRCRRFLREAQTVVPPGDLFPPPAGGLFVPRQSDTFGQSPTSEH
jgi:hypothetical protein